MKASPSHVVRSALQVSCPISLSGVRFLRCWKLLFMQPQLLERPLRRLAFRTSRSVPQTQRQYRQPGSSCMPFPSDPEPSRSRTAGRSGPHYSEEHLLCSSCGASLKDKFRSIILVFQDGEKIIMTLKKNARDCSNAKPCVFQSLPAEGCAAEWVIGQNGRRPLSSRPMEKERISPAECNRIRLRPSHVNSMSIKTGRTQKHSACRDIRYVSSCGLPFYRESSIAIGYSIH